MPIKRSLLVVLSLIVFFSCTTVTKSTSTKRNPEVIQNGVKKEVKPEYSIEITSEEDTNIADIDISYIWNNKDYDHDFDWDVSGILGFNLIVKNNSSKNLKIVWENSSLFYNNKSFLPFLDGQKFIDANTPLKPSVIPSLGIYQGNIFSSEQINLISSRWIVTTISSPEIVIILCLESDSEEYIYNIKLTRIFE